jgi:hypothetical protein
MWIVEDGGGCHGYCAARILLDAIVDEDLSG